MIRSETGPVVEKLFKLKIYKMFFDLEMSLRDSPKVKYWYFIECVKLIEVTSNDLPPEASPAETYSS